MDVARWMTHPGESCDATDVVGQEKYHDQQSA